MGEERFQCQTWIEWGGCVHTGAAWSGLSESKLSGVGVLPQEGLERATRTQAAWRGHLCRKRPSARCQTQVGLRGHPRAGINWHVASSPSREKRHLQEEETGVGCQNPWGWQGVRAQVGWGRCIQGSSQAWGFRILEGWGGQLHRTGGEKLVIIRRIGQNSKYIKVIKVKRKLRKYHSSKTSTETWEPKAMCDSKLDLSASAIKDTTGTNGEQALRI